MVDIFYTSINLLFGYELYFLHRVAVENAEPVPSHRTPFLSSTVAFSQPPLPKTHFLCPKVEKSAAKDTEAILRDHAHSKEGDPTCRKEDFKICHLLCSAVENNTRFSRASIEESKKTHGYWVRTFKLEFAARWNDDYLMTM